MLIQYSACGRWQTALVKMFFCGFKTSFPFSGTVLCFAFGYSSEKRLEAITSFTMTLEFDMLVEKVVVI